MLRVLCDFCGSEMEYETVDVGAGAIQCSERICPDCHAMWISEWDYTGILQVDQTWEKSKARFDELVKAGQIEVNGQCYRYTDDD